MVRNQLGLKRRIVAPGLRGELDMLSAPMRQAVLAACAAYAALGVPYALVGGLAAGALGRPRFTKAVDFLVGEQAFRKSGMVISFALPMPLQAGDVAIDPIPLPEEPRRRAHLARALACAVLDTTTGQPVPMLDATWLAYMKLASPRGKDRDDIVGMMQAGGVDLDALRSAVGGDAELEKRLEAALEELEYAEA